MASADIAGARLHWMERGTGEALVLVHGSASDHRTWAAQLDAFAARHRVIAYSRRFHWPNAPIPPGVDYSMPRHVEDLAALLAALGTGPVNLVGHSCGAYVCLLLALHRPRLVRSIVLAEPPVLPLLVDAPPRPRALMRLLVTRPAAAAAVLRFVALGVAPATAVLRRGDTEGALRYFGRAVLGPDAFRQLSPERMAQVRVNFMPAELLGSGFAPLPADTVRRVEAPTLLVTGAHSGRLFHHLAHRLAALLPRASQVHVPHAGHIVHEDNPAAFNAAVQDFLAEHGRPLTAPPVARRADATG